MSFSEKKNMFDNQDLNIKSHFKFRKENIVILYLLIKFSYPSLILISKFNTKTLTAKEAAIPV